jgi:phage portal protein BeeE
MCLLVPESLPAVMNAVSVISEAVATMPCYLYRVRQITGVRRGNG